jgi:transcription initiation factor TFIID subunit TAF12
LDCFWWDHLQRRANSNHCCCLPSVSAVCWVFFTPSGKNAARSYNKQVEQVALAERENLKQAQTEFKEDIELIEKDINSAKTNTLLEERIISNLTKEINVMGLDSAKFVLRCQV